MVNLAMARESNKTLFGTDVKEVSPDANFFNMTIVSKPLMYSL